MSERSWKLALVGSLVLNAFLLGAIGGGAIQWFSTRGETHAAARVQPLTALRFAASELSPERQQQFLDALKRARREGRDFALEGREARHQVLELLAAPQLDRPALDAALARTRAADTALRTHIEQGVADFAATLTPDERAKFVEGLKRRGQWRLPLLQQKAQQRESEQGSEQGKAQEGQAASE
ncbi:periplasmic heavy metal sensor [Paraburkholderia kururiensis]|uniref:periplasmic heavy metal sensor n=1 Tax=Paraburkholderia kururiensis TaxID=984307 RepID=UPI0005A5D16A|nr:periplasmic heavy metal sensor [Paraburkholderia kururiensis]